MSKRSSIVLLCLCLLFAAANHGNASSFLRNGEQGSSASGKIDRSHELEKSVASVILRIGSGIYGIEEDIQYLITGEAAPSPESPSDPSPEPPEPPSPSPPPPPAPSPPPPSPSPPPPSPPPSP
ncbi:hypothetical protein MARPO_0801s0001, partial [Marchantia polymorpha]